MSLSYVSMMTAGNQQSIKMTNTRVMNAASSFSSRFMLVHVLVLAMRLKYNESRDAVFSDFACLVD